MPVLHEQESQRYFSDQVAPLFMATRKDARSIQAFIESIIRHTLEWANIILPQVVWLSPLHMGKMKGLALPDCWQLKLNLTLISDSGDAVKLIAGLSNVYHELRHFEQVIVALIAMLSNRIPTHVLRTNAVVDTPTYSGRSRLRHAPMAAMNDKLELLAEDFPIEVLEFAYERAMSERYSPAMESSVIFLGQRMNETLLSRQARADFITASDDANRDQHPNSEKTPKQWQVARVKRFTNYVNAFREADAHRVEQGVLDMLRDRYAPGIEMRRVVRQVYLDDPADTYLEDIGPLLFDEPKD
ncbi:Uncharacterised protein [BD1-7 clade bacterium]|uniref:Uncharacterized protein n=1 Tax=BD1-7 clade bacterium TaxID=2029982 RepID=A0A5S9NXJ9_9GAMM|nr:Uncharacterised protein [BD1-7 clade bacterium]CAA0096220.1 Uncharacterised protein [BD1-7 clade bacterium]